MRRGWTLAGLSASLLAGGLMLAPVASAASERKLVPVALFGLPSLHSIIEAIANGFFGALAGALVPSWLKHGSVATIQALVALPDPAGWSHVSALQGEMTYLAAMLMPVTLAVSGLRYWLVGLTGATHPATAVVRCAAVSGVLVAYRWIVEQTVAATNTLTHGILGVPAVGDGLARIIGVLFGGALLSGAGGVFGAFMVIIGVVFAAGLFAAQVLMTVVLAVLIVAGPPLIAVSAIPELSHLSRGWAHALGSVALVPLGWTVLFATAGALCLDATSFTGASGGLPAHIEAAFAGLITFVIAVRLPLMMLGELRHILTRQTLRGHAGSQQASQMPGAERVRAAHARLRAGALAGVPSIGASMGLAAGALGAPRGGAIGVARRRLSASARRKGPSQGSAPPPDAASPRRGGKTHPRGVRERLRHAAVILGSAPAEAASAARASSRRGQTMRSSASREAPRGRASVPDPAPAERAGSASELAGRKRGARTPSASAPPSVPVRAPTRARAGASPTQRAARPPDPSDPSRAQHPSTTRHTSMPGPAKASIPPSPTTPPAMHPAGKLRAGSRREAGAPAPRRAARTSNTQPAGAPSRPEQPMAPQAPRAKNKREKPAVKRRPRSRP